jgi:hypothetical protein
MASDIPIFSAASPVSAPLDVLRPNDPLVSRRDDRKTVKDGTSGGHKHFTVRGRSSETAIQSELSENSKLKTENC